MTIKDFFTKIFSSSINSDEIGLTVKGFLTAIIPATLVIFGLTNINVGQDQLTMLVDAIVNVVVALTTLTSSIAIVWGIVRKIFVAFGWIKTSTSATKPAA